jgi:predicted Zn finger-like uncharacterized protein
VSLATRCIACGTVFRVVQDQLKVSEGWVRCGKCTGVFNALEGLFDLDRDTPPEWPVPTNPAFAPTQPSETDVLNVASLENAPHSMQEAPDVEGDPQVDKIDAQLKEPRDKAVESTPADRINERDRLEFPDARFDSDLPPEETPPLRWYSNDAASQGGATVDSMHDDALTFARHTRQKSWRHRPALRLAQISICLFLLIGVAAQAIHHFRDLIAARWTETAPLLATWCGLAGCAISPPRRIDDVVVESTALTRAPGIDEAFQLSVVLRNRAGAVVARPSIELSLTDLSGRLVARRVLSPVDMRTAPAPMKPGAEAAMLWLLTAGNERVNGYTVEVFYP